VHPYKPAPLIEEAVAEPDSEQRNTDIELGLIEIDRVYLPL